MIFNFFRHILSGSERKSALVKGKAIPVQVSYRPRGFQEGETPRFPDNRHIRVAMLSPAA